MIVILLLVIIAILLFGAAYIRSCMVQIGALVLVAIAFTELKKRLAWIPDGAWWAIALFALFVLICVATRHQHLADEEAKRKLRSAPQSLDEVIERKRGKPRQMSDASGE